MRVVAIAGLETIRDKNDNPIFAVTFLNNIETWKKDHPKTNVTVLDARSYKDLQDPMMCLWNDLMSQGPLDLLLYYGHSDSEILYVISKYRQELENYQRFIDMTTDWENISFNQDAKIYLYGCQAGGMDGKKFDVCIAQDIANKTGVSVYAYVWKSSQQKKKGGYYQLPDRGGFVEFVKNC